MSQSKNLQKLNNLSLSVIIKTKSEPMFKGVAKSVTSVNSDGAFDILPQHANFITLVRQYVKIDKGLDTEKKFEIERGLLYVMSNNVEVYAGV